MGCLASGDIDKQCLITNRKTATLSSSEIDLFDMHCSASEQLSLRAYSMHAAVTRDGIAPLGSIPNTILDIQPRSAFTD